ncbi:MAG: hypothetical protein P4L84_05470 [Isosphaeraceae bacterium]|nr:hypothetical protein [Isosphaeraceae bacterium]
MIRQTTVSSALLEIQAPIVKLRQSWPGVIASSTAGRSAWPGAYHPQQLGTRGKNQAALVATTPGPGFSTLKTPRGNRRECRVGLRSSPYAPEWPALSIRRKGQETKFTTLLKIDIYLLSKNLEFSLIGYGQTWYDRSGPRGVFEDHHRDIPEPRADGATPEEAAAKLAREIGDVADHYHRTLLRRVLGDVRAYCHGGTDRKSIFEEASR